MYILKKFKQFLLPLAAAAVITAIIGMGALQRLDRWLQDELFQHQSVTSSDIIIIGIDEDAFDLLGPYNTWDRNIIASALEVLASDPDNKPAVTAIDVLYAGNSSAQADDRLAKAAEALGSVVTATVAEFGESVTWENERAVSIDTSAILHYAQPYEALAEVTEQGHINAVTDSDGVMRHAMLYVEPDGNRVYSMSAQAARIYLEKHGRRLSLPKTVGKGYYYISYTGQPGAFYDGVSIAWLLSGKVPSGYWADKIVLIGPYAAALQDAYITSINKGEQMFGVEIQANLIQSLMEGRFKQETPDRIQLIALFVLLAVTAVLFSRLKLLHSGGVCAGLIVLGIGVPLLLYRAGFVLHPLWLPTGALVLYILALIDHYVRAARERRALALEKERIGAELALAKRIQANSLPKEFPPFPDRHEFDIFASMTPAKEVGGDLYDFFMKDEDHLVLVIGDVAGKGVPASLFMMVAMSLIHHVAMREESPAKALGIVNEEICARNPEEMFVTVWLGILEISTGKLTAASAGHEFPALKSAGGHFELVKDRHGFVIGGMDGVRYRDYELRMEPGAKLFVYTDGVPEATNAAEELFGPERMIAALQSSEDGSPEEVLDAIKRAVQVFVGDAPQFDDLTMLCLQYNGFPDGTFSPAPPPK